MVRVRRSAGGSSGITKTVQGGPLGPASHAIDPGSCSPFGRSLRRLVDDDADGLRRQEGSVGMSPRYGQRRGWRLAVATAAAVAAAGVLPSVASSATPTTSTRDDHGRACAHRQNNTPKKLVACVTRRDLWAHMVKFQQIADANPGADGHPSRNSGEPGYKASADYVAKVMRQAGYKVHLQEYKFHYTSFVGDPSMKEESPSPSPSRSGRTLSPELSPVRRRPRSSPSAASSYPRHRPPARPAAARPPTSPGSSPATSP